MFKTRGIPTSPLAASAAGRGLYLNKRLYFQSNKLGKGFPSESVLEFAEVEASTTFEFPSNSEPRAQRFPVINFREELLVLKVFIVSKQLLLHLPQRRNSKSTEKLSNCSKEAKL